MKVHRRKAVVLATVAALIVNTVVGAFTAMGLTEDELTAAGCAAALAAAENTGLRDISAEKIRSELKMQDVVIP